MDFQADKNHIHSFLHRLVSGDSRAFAEFVQKYQQEVFLCCRTLGLNKDEAEDVASEAFLAAYQGISKFAGKSKINTWLWKITYNKAMNFLRKKIHRQKLQQYLEKNYNEEAANTILDDVEYIWKAVEKLPNDQALAIVLFYKQDKSIKEIVGITQKSENNLFRGREKLKELLADKVERLTNAAQ